MPLYVLIFCFFLLIASPTFAADTGMNHLANEKSPYLLQHKDNPVWWWPWGDDPFDRAQEEDKLIFLSIGYSTCHWCHVMEHESFEDAKVAEFLNKHFISIKVDREERPDVDQVYMKSVQAFSGRGGWPMSVFLTPDRKPIFGGTYYPKEHFLKVLSSLNTMWKEDRQSVLESKEKIMTFLSQGYGESTEYKITGDLLEEFVHEAEHSFDIAEGGFGGAPKFPPSAKLRVLLRRFHAKGNSALKKMVFHSLDKMALGGLYDPIGGGFHRYATDAAWKVPHFEKMLYDNAGLALVYLEAYQVSQESFYKEVAFDTLEFVRREMTSPNGGFFSAQDADSEGREGAFYVWTLAELQKVLSQAELKELRKHVSLTEQGNFEEGANIVRLESTRSWKWLFSERGIAIRTKLRVARSKRPRPLLDDKWLTAWNGLMIEAFAKASRVSGQDQYLEDATKAASAVRSALWKEGQLYRRYRAGDVRFAAVLDDYAYLISSLLELYQAGGDPQWLTWAAELQQKQDDLFWDDTRGGYFYSQDKLILKEKVFFDDARPNSNGVSALNLIKLADLTLHREYRIRAKKVVESSMAFLSKAPFACPSLFLAIDYLLADAKELALVRPKGESEKSDLHRFIHSTFYPYLVIASGQVGEERVPLLRGRPLLKNSPTAYVCELGACKLPTTELEVLRKQLE